MSYPILQLRPKKERAVLLRHPWIFSGAVQQLPPAANGDIVEVRTAEGQTLAWGFFSPESQIVCRLFAFAKGMNATGKWAGYERNPTLQFNTAFWESKISHALALRRRLIDSASTNCYRLLHAEGDFFPGLIADVYNDTVVLQVLIKGTETLLPQIAQAIRKQGFQYIFLKSKFSTHHLEGLPAESHWIGEPRPEMPIEVKEHYVKFLVNPEKGQKTGFFIDQRENRLLLRRFAEGKRVLNTFAYTGGFSIYALAGGACEVVSVDISKEAVALSEDNVRLNFGSQAAHKAVAADCFDYLRQMNEEFDIVVLDPPAFAKNARAVPNAARGYKDLNYLALKKIKPQGLLLTFSCSQNIDKVLFQKIVFGAAADAGREVRILQHLEQPADHPVNIYHPEGEYLKGLLLWVE
ncbi:MAG: class I SAM-dependent rRNA methyltransferase [Cytophagales bacterium]|nr:class I SAM-dependent rRNA methyltransferase [Cytophagales bacterium]